MSRMTLTQFFERADQADTFVLSPRVLPGIPLALGDRAIIRTASDAVTATSALLKEFLHNGYAPDAPEMQNVVDVFYDLGLKHAADSVGDGSDSLGVHDALDILQLGVWPRFRLLWPRAPHVYVGFKGPGSFKFGVYVDFEHPEIDRLPPVKKIMVGPVPASRRPPPPVRS